MSVIKRRSFLKSISSFCIASSSPLLAPAILRAQGSSGPITLIVAGPGGARSGLAGRILSAALQKELGRPVNLVDYDSPREGYLRLAAAEPDGTTYGIIGADMPALNRGIGGSPGIGSFTPIALLSEDPAGIHVRREAPWRSVAELTASIRSTPGRLKASGAARHAVWHLSAERWTATAKAGAAALPWEAAPNPAAAAENLVAGGPDIVVCSTPEIRATPFAPSIRTLALMSQGRLARYPEIAALAESGIRVRAGWWRGVAGPRGLSGQQVAQMQAVFQRVNASEDYRRQMIRRGFSPTWAGGTQFARFIATEDQAMAAAIRGLG